MRRQIALFLACCLARPVLARDESSSARICRVAVLGNEVGQPDDHNDGLIRLRVFVSASTSCQSGSVEVAVFPATICRSQPQTDLDDSKPMTFAYKPHVAADCGRAGEHRLRCRRNFKWRSREVYL
jgi:hypothetical protein